MSFIEDHPEEVEQDLFFNDQVIELVSLFIKYGEASANNSPVLFDDMFNEVSAFMEVGLTAYKGNLIRMMVDNADDMPAEMSVMIHAASELKEISFNELHNASTTHIKCFEI